MKCSNCGSEVEKGTVFCGNCGNKIVWEQQQVVSGEYASDGIVFCPNCGKKMDSESAFCDECGFRLDGKWEKGKTTDFKQFWKAHGKINVKVLVLAGVLAVVVLGAGAFTVARTSGIFNGEPSHLVYFKDDSMMMIDLSRKNAKPQVLTDAFGEDYFVRRCLSKDGKYVVYGEDYDGESYDLFLTKVSKPAKGKKIDSHVNRFILLDNNHIVYQKKDDLYYYNGKDSVRLAKNVLQFRLDNLQKNIFWEENKKMVSSYYLQDLNQKKDAVKLEDDLDDIYSTDNLEFFYGLKDGKLYLINAKGEKTTIAKNVTSINRLEYSGKTGMVIYEKSIKKEIPYSDIIYDDTGKMSEYYKKELEKKKYSYEEKGLYLYDGKEEKVLTECMGATLDAAVGDGDNEEAYTLFMEYPEMGDIRVPWSLVKSAGLENTINTERQEESILVMTVGSERIGEFEDISVRDGDLEVKSGTAYVYVTDESGEDGMIYRITSKGADRGKLEEIDDAEDGELLLACEKGLYYLKDKYDYFSGDLYFNGEEIATDVHYANKIGDTEMISFISDFDKEERSGTLYIKNGKNIKQVAEDVYFHECIEDGSAIFITDYSQESGEGDLMYFDGKKLRKLDSDVRFFCPRKYSTEIAF